MQRRSTRHAWRLGQDFGESPRVVNLRCKRPVQGSRTTNSPNAQPNNRPRLRQFTLNGRGLMRSLQISRRRFPVTARSNTSPPTVTTGANSPATARIRTGCSGQPQRTALCVAGDHPLVITEVGCADGRSPNSRRTGFATSSRSSTTHRGLPDFPVVTLVTRYGRNAASPSRPSVHDRRMLDRHRNRSRRAVRPAAVVPGDRLGDEAVGRRSARPDVAPSR